jgi:hypothetical protein
MQLMLSRHLVGLSEGCRVFDAARCVLQQSFCKKREGCDSYCKSWCSSGAVAELLLRAPVVHRSEQERVGVGPAGGGRCASFENSLSSPIHISIFSSKI